MANANAKAKVIKNHRKVAYTLVYVIFFLYFCGGKDELIQK